MELYSLLDECRWKWWVGGKGHKACDGADVLSGWLVHWCLRTIDQWTDCCFVCIWFQCNGFSGAGDEFLHCRKQKPGFFLLGSTNVCVPLQRSTLFAAQDLWIGFLCVSTSAIHGSVVACSIDRDLGNPKAQRHFHVIFNRSNCFPKISCNFNTLTSCLPFLHYQA